MVLHFVNAGNLKGSNILFYSQENQQQLTITDEVLWLSSEAYPVLKFNGFKPCTEFIE